MSIFRFLSCALAVCLGSIAWGASNFQLSVFPIFLGEQKATGLVPLRVSISNLGPDAVGTLHLASGGYLMDYPVELPEASSKNLIVYTMAGQGVYDSFVELRTNRGSAKKDVDPAGMNPSPGDYFLEIGGNPGDLGFLEGGQNGTAQVAPENTPDRVCAFQGCNMILLASGAERISDGTVAALKLYILSGGLLVFPSGVASPLLTDGRWQGILPVQPLQPHAETDDSLLRSIAIIRNDKKSIPASPIKKPYSVIDFTPLKGTKTAKQGGINLIGARNYGLGKVVFWSFDPLHGSLRDWPGLGQFFRRSAHFALPAEEAVISLNSVDQIQPGLVGGFPAQKTDDPFQVTMPKTITIGAILALYFLCVIPLNFFVLKKLGKRHWGWTTSCLISLVFAGVMLSQASNLYGIPTSHSDKVVVVGQKGFERVLATGSSQMFTAKGGTYDLAMDNLDAVTPRDDNGYNYSPNSNSGMKMLSPVDTGKVQIKDAQFRNLGFGEMSFEQELDSQYMPTVAQKGKGYVIKANTKLVDACLLTPHGDFGLGEIPSGGSAIADPNKNRNKNVQVYIFAEYLNAVRPWIEHGECVLIASAPDLPVGPSLGKKLPPSPVLVYFAGDDL